MPTPATSTALAVEPPPRVDAADVRVLLDAWPAAAGPSLTRPGPPRAASRCRAPLVPKLSRCRGSPTTASCCAGCARRTCPGHFPFTAGVFPFKREDEDPARMFAGEGGPARTNRRFHLLAEGQPATRLSTAFDSVTLYGFDPAERPDIYGKVGNSGVSIATLDDMKVLYAGFDLCDPTTSVSMTINGPAPTILAMFLNTAIDQQLDGSASTEGREPSAEERGDPRPDARTVRGTVQADILKEDQGQNTCIFSTEFSLGVMADIAEWFVEHQVRNFYSVSISGYHIAEAGANPISQLAFTLANGFTYVESYLARGMDVDDFAPNLSFFFSNGMDPEYTVLGRVARRIWAIAMRDRYGANERSPEAEVPRADLGPLAARPGDGVQRHPHHAAGAVRDLRQRQQPAHQRLRRGGHHADRRSRCAGRSRSSSSSTAEWGLAMNENPLQGSFIVEELTDLVEEAVLAELDRISERGGVLGAMETGYQRGRIQDESMLYEHRKHDGTLPIVGVNTFLRPERATTHARPTSSWPAPTTPRSSDQIERLRDFQAAPRRRAPAALERLRARRRSPATTCSTCSMDAVRLLHARRDHRDAVRRRGPLPPQRLTRPVARAGRHRAVGACVSVSAIATTAARGTVADTCTNQSGVSAGWPTSCEPVSFDSTVTAPSAVDVASVPGLSSDGSTDVGPWSTTSASGPLV